MFKRLKKLWKLSTKDEKTIQEFMKLSDKEIMALPDEGDGNAVFIGEGTDEEYQEFLREEEGTKPWYDRLKNLL